jgi:hypothetical protein
MKNKDHDVNQLKRGWLTPIGKGEYKKVKDKDIGIRIGYHHVPDKAGIIGTFGYDDPRFKNQ